MGGLAVYATGAFIIFVSYLIARAMRKGRKRSMSFNSSVLIDGAFPDAAKVVPPMINIVTHYEQCPSVEKIVDALQKLLIYDRFRCAPKLKRGKWVFTDVEVDLKANHVSTITVNGEAELLATIDKINVAELPGSGDRPLWHVHRIVNTGAGLSAVLFRIHHVIGDGIGLVGTMSKLFIDEETNDVIALDIPERMRSSDGKKSGFTMLLKVFFAFVEVLGLALSPYDTNLAFNAPDKSKMSMSSNRKTVIFPTISLDFVKQIKKRASATINDVLLAATTGAIRRYCESRGNTVKTDALLRSLMPVAFPRPKKEMSIPSRALRNKWAFISVPMPVGEADPIQRLVSCQSTTAMLKKSPLAFVQLWVQSNLLPLLPKFLQQKTAYDIFSRHSIVFSNVPGPGTTVSFCGHRLMSLQIMFPNLLPQVIIISYGGEIFYNMSLDPQEMPGADTELPRFFLEELKSLAKSYNIDCNDCNILAPKSVGGHIATIRK